MQRRTFNSLAGTALFAAGRGNAAAVAPPPPLERQYPRSPVNIGTQAQLLVDQMLVRETCGVSFTMLLGEKHPGNPIMAATEPWEGWNIELFGSVLYDEDENLFKMWYVGQGAGLFPPGDYPTMYATSRDGIHWEKPLVGTITGRDGRRRHNVVSLVQQPNVIKDRREPDPRKRYKMIAWVDDPQSEKGFYTYTSPDGFAWKQFSPGRIALHHLPTVPKEVPDADNIIGYYDERRGTYIAFPKIMVKVGGFYRRSYRVMYSRDFETWSEPQLVLTADPRDDAGMLWRIEQSRPLLEASDDPSLMRTEFYGLGVYPAESCTLGFLWILTVNNKATTFPRNQDGPG